MQNSKTDYYAELTKLMEAYPDLVFNNNGYQEIPDSVKKINADGIAKVEALLKESVADFVRFQNFKPRNDGSFAVRCQTRWSPYFIGVSYFPLDNFKTLKGQ